MNPEEQGLKHKRYITVNRAYGGLRDESRRTRIETAASLASSPKGCRVSEMNPEEQGLKRRRQAGARMSLRSLRDESRRTRIETVTRGFRSL